MHQGHFIIALHQPTTTSLTPAASFTLCYRCQRWPAHFMVRAHILRINPLKFPVPLQLLQRVHGCTLQQACHQSWKLIQSGERQKMVLIAAGCNVFSLSVKFNQSTKSAFALSSVFIFLFINSPDKLTLGYAQRCCSRIDKPGKCLDAPVDGPTQSPLNCFMVMFKTLQ